MDITYVVAGRLAREYLLPATGTPMLDSAGGSALYACGGLLPWAGEVGILARAGDDFPRSWLRDFQKYGADTSGISILPQALDLRSFLAYDAQLQVTQGSPVSQFARRGLTFPKALLGYQPPAAGQKDARTPDISAPAIADIPAAYLDARAVHVCPLDLTSQHQLTTTFKAHGVTTLTVDPLSAAMSADYLPELRILLSGITAFIPSEEELRGLFWGKTYDLWEMVAALGEYGCEFVVVKCGPNGQAVYDAKGRHRWEVPAYPARRTDPTGAGDAFCGGFLAGYKQTYDPLQATLRGNIAASLKVEGSGPFYPLTVLSGLAEARLEVLKDLVREI